MKKYAGYLIKGSVASKLLRTIGSMQYPRIDVAHINSMPLSDMRFKIQYTPITPQSAMP